MARLTIDLNGLSLDEFGRVVLSDDLLDQIEDCTAILSAGANSQCTGSANGSCTNISCGNSSNGWCTNTIHCSGSSNATSCQRPREVE